MPATVAAPLAGLLVASLLVAAPAGRADGVGEAEGTDGGAAGDGLRILLDEVDPVVVRPGQSVTLRGRLVNDGPEVSRLNLLTVAAVDAPLSSRAEVTSWVDGADERVASVVLGDDALGAAIGPGEQGGFEVTVPASALGVLPLGPAVLGVELVAAVEEEADRFPVPDDPEPAVLRTVLTSTGRPSTVDVPLETSWIVPLTLPPDADLSSPDDTAHTAAWLTAVGQGSAVRTWLDHLTVPEVTWWVDPAALMAHRPADALAVPAEDPEETEDSDEPERTEAPDETGPGRTEAPEETGERSDEQPDDEPGDPGGTGIPTPDPAATTAGPAGPTGPTGAGNDGEGTTTSPDTTTSTAPAAPVPPPEPDPDAEPVPEPGPDEETLDEAVRRLRQVLADVNPRSLWWLPTDDPDLAVLADLAGEAEVVPGELAEDLLTRLPTGAPAEVGRLLRQGRDDVAWPALAAPTAADVASIAELYDRRPASSAGLGAVLVPRETFTADSSAPPRLGAIPLGDQPDVLAIGADSWTSGLVAAVGADAEQHGAGAAAQRLLAHTLGTWRESPGSPRSLVIAPPRGTAVPADVLDQLSTGWARARWLEPVSADELLDRADDLEPVALSGVAPQEEVLGPLTKLLVPPASPMTTSRAADHVDLQQDLDGLAQILRDTDALRSWEPVFDAQWSTRWRQDESAWVSSSRTLRHKVSSTREAVSLLPSTVNFIADQGVVHLTVVNELPVAVEDVRVRVRPDNGRLQVTSQPEPVDIGPGSRASVPFQARAITRGDTVLHVQLSTPGGTTLGAAAEVDVRVQPTGVWIYWVLGGLAGLVLVLGLRRALTSGPTEHRAPTPAPSPSSNPAPSADAPRTAYPDPAPPPGKEKPE